MTPSLEPSVTSWPCCEKQGWPQRAVLVPCSPGGVSWQPYVRAETVPLSGESLLHSLCFLNLFPPRMSQADPAVPREEDGPKTAVAGTLLCVLSAQAAPVPTSPFCTHAAVCETDTCSCHSRKLAVPPLVSLPVPLVTAARARAEAGPWGLPPLWWGPRGRPARVTW